MRYVHSNELEVVSLAIPEKDYSARKVQALAVQRSMEQEACFLWFLFLTSISFCAYVALVSAASAFARASNAATLAADLLDCLDDREHTDLVSD